MTGSAIDLPESGYAITTVYAHEQILRPRTPEDDENAGHATFGWDWRDLPVKGAFEVSLRLNIYPSDKRPEFVSVATVGRFEIVGSEPAVTLDDFVSVQAVAILLPYARQFISNLTANSPFGCFYLPTINVQKLMAGVDKSQATGAGSRKPMSRPDPNDR